MSSRLTIKLTAGKFLFHDLRNSIHRGYSDETKVMNSLAEVAWRTLAHYRGDHREVKHNPPVAFWNTSEQGSHGKWKLFVEVYGFRPRFKEAAEHELSQLITAKIIEDTQGRIPGLIVIVHLHL